MSRPLRVLHVISSVSANAGGPTVAAHNMLKALARRGIRADLATTDDNGRAGRLTVPLGEPVDLHGQRIWYFPRQNRRYGFSYPLARWLERSTGQYDLVHTTGLYSFAPLAAAWHAREAGIPYIMRPAGMLDSWGMKHKSPIVKRLSIAVLEGPLLEGAAAVHFMSELERTRANERGRRLRAVVLPMGFDFEDASPESPDLGLADLELGTRPVILYLSRIDYMKGVDVLLRAFAALPSDSGATLLIAGDGVPSLVAELRDLAASLRLGSRVRWLGFIQGARKHALFKRADVFALPSASENFGVAVIEAMNAARPVIVTQGVGVAELVARTGAGLVTDGSVEGLRAALAQLLGDGELRRRSGEAGRRAVAAELSLDAFGSRLESLYRSVLAAAPAAMAS
jgi:glycosyltransferase involved in cell wall biosynthesis